MAPTMSQYYDSDRQALRARLVELRNIAPPSHITLTKMMSGCRDEKFRRTMELAFEGSRRLRMISICGIASELPWHPSQERSSHDGVVSKILIGVGIVAGLGLTYYTVKRQYQVRRIAGEKRKREEDEEAEIENPKPARDQSESRKRAALLPKPKACSPSDPGKPPLPGLSNHSSLNPSILTPPQDFIVFRDDSNGNQDNQHKDSQKTSRKRMNLAWKRRGISFILSERGDKSCEIELDVEGLVSREVGKFQWWLYRI